jgi:hypothetical protein
LLEEDAVPEEDAGVELAAGVDEELSDPKLDFNTPSVEEADDESLLPSLELEEPSFELPSDFGAAEDFDG